MIVDSCSVFDADAARFNFTFIRNSPAGFGLHERLCHKRLAITRVLMSKHNGPVGVKEGVPEPTLRHAPAQSIRRDGNSAIDAGAERAALSRLRIAANLSGGTQVREIKAGIQSGFTGWWFGLRLWR